MLLSQRDLDWMRSVQNDHMPDTCTIERPTRVSDGRGGYTTSYVAVYTNIPCRFWISSGTSGTSTETRHWGEHEMAVTESFIITRWDRDVRNEDRVTWTERDAVGTRVLQVVGTNKDDSYITAARIRVIGVR